MGAGPYIRDTAPIHVWEMDEGGEYHEVPTIQTMPVTRLATVEERAEMAADELRKEDSVLDELSVWIKEDRAGSQWVTRHFEGFDHFWEWVRQHPVPVLYWGMQCQGIVGDPHLPPGFTATQLPDVNSPSGLGGVTQVRYRP